MAIVRSIRSTEFEATEVREASVASEQAESEEQ
jgi:hypothetical protein